MKIAGDVGSRLGTERRPRREGRTANKSEGMGSREQGDCWL